MHAKDQYEPHTRGIVLQVNVDMYLVESFIADQWIITIYYFLILFTGERYRLSHAINHNYYSLILLVS